MLVLYFQLVAGMSALQAGLAMVPGMVTAAVGFQVAPRLAARWRPGHVIAGGLAAESVVLAGLTGLGAPTSAPLLVVGFALTAFGIGTVGLGTGLVVGSAPPDKRGMAGSVAQIANELGGMLGIALLGTLGTAVYRDQMRGAVPASVPAPAAGTARDSLAGAAAVADALPEPASSALRTAAREAFTSGLHAVVAVGAVLLAGAAVLIAVNLRRVPPFDRRAQGDRGGEGPAGGHAGAAASGRR